MDLPPLDEIRKHFRYEADGTLIWVAKTNKGTVLGSVAGSLYSNGYVTVVFRRKHIGAHRIVWALHNGRWPVGDIDHINMVRNDNRVENLREASRSQNKCNTGKPSTNTSGYKGVDFVKREGKWRVRISVAGIVKPLGYFDDPELAGLVYAEAARKWHGEFARVY